MTVLVVPAMSIFDGRLSPLKWGCSRLRGKVRHGTRTCSWDSGRRRLIFPTIPRRSVACTSPVEVRPTMDPSWLEPDKSTTTRLWRHGLPSPVQARESATPPRKHPPTTGRKCGPLSQRANGGAPHPPRRSVARQNALPTTRQRRHAKRHLGGRYGFPLDRVRPLSGVLLTGAAEGNADGHLLLEPAWDELCVLRSGDGGLGSTARHVREGRMGAWVRSGVARVWSRKRM